MIIKGSIKQSVPINSKIHSNTFNAKVTDETTIKSTLGGGPISSTTVVDFGDLDQNSVLFYCGTASEVIE